MTAIELAILSSMPTYLNWSGAYWALACLPDDAAVLTCTNGGLLIAAAVPVFTVCPTADACKILVFLLDEYLNFLRFDFLDTCGSLSKVIWLWDVLFRNYVGYAPS